MFKIKNHFADWYRPQQSFVVRNPLFPIETFFNWRTGDVSNIDEQKEILIKILREFYQQPVAQEALYIGSPDLHVQLQLWLNNKIEKKEKKEKTELSLVKYMIRMCTRCTPYGLFATCTTGKFSETSSIQLQSKEFVQRHGRLDMDYVCQLHSHLLKQKEIADQLIFYPNNSLYRVGDQWRYIEHRFTKETGRSYHLVEIDQSSYLEKILTAAESGRKPAELIELISTSEQTEDIESVSVEEANGFINELIQNQVLVDELEPSVTGEEYFSVFLRKLKELNHVDNYVAQLENVASIFKLIKHEKIAEKNNYYQQIVNELKQSEVEVHLKTLIQVDSYRQTDQCNLNSKINDEILRGMSLLQLLTPENRRKDAFEDFKNAFTNRYEAEWIPLVEVLDTEGGIGYGKFATSGMEESPLIDKLPFGNGIAESSSARDAENFIWKVYQEAISKNKTEITIDDKVVEELSKKEFQVVGLPDSIFTMLKINAASAEEIDKGNYSISLNSPSGPSGGNLLGRFCHLADGIEDLTRNILRDEELHHTDCIYAEIVHLPESRIGNILMRPLLREHEIPYLCNSIVDKEFQIPVTDLLIGIEEGQVKLWSKKLNRQVIPRMTTAHNYHMTTLPIYQFLCDLQYQGIRQVGWNWGLLENRPFLPRISYGRFILTHARWLLSKEDLKDFEKQNDEELKKRFEEIRELKRLPEYILLSQGDNELLLHLKNIFCIRLLLAEVNKAGMVMLVETLDLPGQCWIASNDGHHAGEFIASFSRKTEAQQKLLVTDDSQKEQPNIQRSFSVGSDWLYAKIYCGTKTAEKLLSNTLRAFTEQLLDEKIIDKFFFLRYQDPGHHIRIRFHNSTQPDFWKEIISRLKTLLEPWFENHTVHNLQFETYRREIERYGVDTMELSEDIFWYQSDSVLNFISMLEGDEGEQYRWQVALKAIDMILDDFAYSLEQKRDLIRFLNKNFSEEFKVGSAERKKMSERFSGHKQLVQSLLSDEWQNDENLAGAIHVFVNQDKSYRQVIEKILELTSASTDRRRINDLMSSYLHMFINRLFVSNQRKTELVIYEYLWKYYESKIARESMAKNISEPVKTSS